MTTPYWVQDAIFYQIFPDRFANGDPSIDPPNVQKWGALPDLWHSQGGDLRGILQKLDYLLDLGVTALYLNPIFESASTHRYNTNDYFKIDHRLGTLTDFHILLDAAHRNGMHVIIDGVFNHCGRGFFAFMDVIENNEYSAYVDWFHIQRFPLDACGPGQAQNYQGWWGFKSLPKFNTRNPQVRNYIMKVAQYWMERGADGWRLDVPNEIDDDAFWEEFRHVVKSVNRDAYILGEIWTVDRRWADDKHFDGLMNYPLRDILLAALNGTADAVKFGDRVEELLKAYPREHVYSMYNNLGSHDVERLATLLDNSLDKIKLAYLFQMAYPGAPAIYYGDEVGLEGGKDPDCRRAFPWDSADWKGDLRPWLQQLIAIRKSRPSLRRGDYKRLLAVDGVYAFVRGLGEEKTLAVVNFSQSQREFSIPVNGFWPDGYTPYSLLTRKGYRVAEGQVTLNLQAYHGDWLA
jgi:glycosidase